MVFNIEEVGIVSRADSHLFRRPLLGSLHSLECCRLGEVAAEINPNAQALDLHLVMKVGLHQRRSGVAFGHDQKGMSESGTRAWPWKAFASC